MKQDGQRELRPKLRFPGFQDEPGWEEKRLYAIAEPVSEKAEAADDAQVLTLSGEHGLVLQSEYFGKRVAGSNSERYIKIARNDFVYNDRTTKESAFGTIKRLSSYDGGIVSPIYKCFRFNGGENSVFWDWYFASGIHDAQLRTLVNEGARAGRFNISVDKFLATAVWRPSDLEQHKIADCLSSLDEVIAAEARKVEALEACKKGLMQQLFPLEGETLPRVRFPEFRNTPAWEEKEVGEVFKVTRGDVLAMTLVQDDKTIEAPFPVYSSQTKKRGLAGYYSDFLYENAITWTTDGANAGAVNYRPGKFYCTNVCGVLISNGGFANPCMAELINSVSRKHVSYVGNPKLMNGVMAKISIPFPKIEEQRRIADCLSSLEDLIVAQGEKLAALKAHEKGLMQQLFPTPEEDEA